jgi:hypothetical protein
MLVLQRVARRLSNLDPIQISLTPERRTERQKETGVHFSLRKLVTSEGAESFYSYIFLC